MKKARKNKTVVVKFRAEEKEANRGQLLANIYAEGNLSNWCRYAMLNAPRKYLRKQKERG